MVFDKLKNLDTLKLTIQQFLNSLILETREIFADIKKIVHSDEKLSLKFNQSQRRIWKTSTKFKISSIVFVSLLLSLTGNGELSSKELIKNLESGKFQVVSGVITKDTNGKIIKCSEVIGRPPPSDVNYYRFTDGKVSTESFRLLENDEFRYHFPWTRSSLPIEIDDTTHIKDGNKLMLAKNGQAAKEFGDMLCVFDKYRWPIEKMRSGKPIELNFYSRKRGCPNPYFRVHPLMGIQWASANYMSGWGFDGFERIPGKSITVKWLREGNKRASLKLELLENGEIFATPWSNVSGVTRYMFNGRYYPCYD